MPMKHQVELLNMLSPCYVHSWKENTNITKRRQLSIHIAIAYPICSLTISCKTRLLKCSCLLYKIWINGTSTFAGTLQQGEGMGNSPFLYSKQIFLSKSDFRKTGTTSVYAQRQVQWNLTLVWVKQKSFFWFHCFIIGLQTSPQFQPLFLQSLDKIKEESIS